MTTSDRYDSVGDNYGKRQPDRRTVLGARFAKNPIELDIPIYITGMSFGALSLEAKMALAKGASMAGTACAASRCSSRSRTGTS